MPRLTDQILFLMMFGERLLPELGEVLRNPGEYGRLLPQGNRAVRRALRRMVGRQELRMKNKESWEMTKMGHERVGGMWPHLVAGKWDHKWRVVVFDIPERYRGLRAILRRFLSSVGFVGMQRSLWVAPFMVTEEVVAFLEASRLDQMSLVMEVEKMLGMNTEALVKRAWKAEEWRQRYADFGMACGVAPSQTRLPPGMAKSLQRQFVRLVFGDPWLPVEIAGGDWGRGRAMTSYGRLLEKS